jgi:hypothetical protein
MRTEPVADTSGKTLLSAIAWPTSAPPTSSPKRPAGQRGNSAATRAASAWHARAQSGVFSDGFHTTGSPHTTAIAAFQAQTATGKLNALMTPTGPSGCQYSVRRCPGRSLAMVSP